MAPLDTEPSCPHSNLTRAVSNTSRAGRTNSTIRRSGPIVPFSVGQPGPAQRQQRQRRRSRAGARRRLSLQAAILRRAIDTGASAAGSAQPIQPDKPNPARQGRTRDRIEFSPAGSMRSAGPGRAHARTAALRFGRTRGSTSARSLRRHRSRSTNDWIRLTRACRSLSRRRDPQACETGRLGASFPPSPAAGIPDPFQPGIDSR
jgi:hypothetical protein